MSVLQISTAVKCWKTEQCVENLVPLDRNPKIESMFRGISNIFLFICCLITIWQFSAQFLSILMLRQKKPDLWSTQTFFHTCRMCKVQRYSIFSLYLKKTVHLIFFSFKCRMLPTATRWSKWLLHQRNQYFFYKIPTG